MNNPFRGRAEARAPVEEFLDGAEALQAPASRRSILGRKKVLAPDAFIDQSIPLESAHNPIGLILGSISGASLKDANAYARGLAESVLIAPEIGHIYVWEDKDNMRYAYEIHEGGPGYRVGPNIVKALSEGRDVRIALTNGCHVKIEEAHGEIYSLVYPAAADELVSASGAPRRDLAVIEQITDYTDKKHKLALVIPQRKTLVPLGAVVLGLSCTMFFLTGVVFLGMKTHILQEDFLMRQVQDGYMAQYEDNPVKRMSTARIAAEAEGKAIDTLKKGPEGWSHTLK